jgi:Bacterial membrane protein YfhO
VAGGRWRETRERRWIAAAAAATGMLLATGGVSMIYFGSWFLAVVLGARAFAEGERGRALAGLGAAALLGAALAAPVLLPAAAQGPRGRGARGGGGTFASEFGWSHYGYVATLVFPNVFGDQAIGTWKGGGTQWELGGYYAGLLPFAAAVWAIARGARERRGERVALALLALLAIGIARDGSLVQRAAFRVLPLLSAMRCPARAAYVFSLAVPLLAADGLDGLAARLPERWRGRALVAAVALVAIDLLVAHRHWNPSQTLAEARAAGGIAVKEALGARPGERFVNDVHLDHALHNAGLAWGMENASGYNSLPIWRYLHYLWIANHGAPYPHARIEDDLSAQGLWRFSSPLVDGLAVKWVVAAKPPNGPGYERKFAGSDGVDLWENREALPRAWVVHRARVVDGEAAAARAIAGELDPRAEVVLEEAPSVAPEGEGMEEAAKIEEVGQTGMVVEVKLARPGVLVVAEPWYPGWTATVDGKGEKLLLANLALRAVALPAGAHRVEMRYRSAAVERGLLVAGVAILAVGLLLVRGRAGGRGRRRSPG